MVTTKAYLQKTAEHYVKNGDFSIDGDNQVRFYQKALKAYQKAGDGKGVDYVKNKINNVVGDERLSTHLRPETVKSVISIYEKAGQFKEAAVLSRHFIGNTKSIAGASQLYQRAIRDYQRAGDKASLKEAASLKENLKGVRRMDYAAYKRKAAKEEPKQDNRREGATRRRLETVRAA